VVDVRETADALLVQAELPGLGVDDVDVRVENGTLTISGEKRQEIEEGKDDSGYRLVERCYGRFERSFTLPLGVDAEQVKAEFANGVLTVTLPKAEEAKPRRIEVKVTNGKRARIGSK
jgi:HSP20 family protein